MKSQLFLQIIHDDDPPKIRCEWYAMERLAIDPLLGRLQWALQKLDLETGELLGELHVVTVDRQGRIKCDCEDATYGNNPNCKHKRELLNRGLLPKGK